MPRQIRMSQFPEARPPREVWQFTEDGVSELRDGEVSVRIDWLSVDPGMSGWITDKPNYMRPVQPGEVMRAFGVGEVVESRSPHFDRGDWVTGFLGLQTHGVYRDRLLRKIDPQLAPPQMFLSGLGMTGYTAYFGMMDIGRPASGETIVVSAASGAVGSVAVQLAKQAGGRVIGIAGGEEKCSYLRDVLQLDGVIDYKSGQLADQVEALTPDGVDLYYDNVGGDILDLLLTRMNYKGRIVVCGAISQYSETTPTKGPQNLLRLVTHSLAMRGFTMKDYMSRIPEAVDVLSRGWKEGSLVFREHILDGLDNFPEAYEMLFDGRNNGKLLIKV